VKTYTKVELKKIIEEHGMWLRGEGGKHADLTRANLTRANLTHADLTCANLTRANLTHVDLTCANLTHADLTHADLTCANLTHADLTHADLTCADLAGADFARANLTHVDLTCANLTHADLTHADLTGAYLSGANLTRANLTHADLTCAYLAGANMTGARGITPERCTPLLMLMDQPGFIRAYKIVNKKNEGIYMGGLKYEVGKTLEIENANTDPNQQCAAGINLSTLDWCLKVYQPGYKVLICEFTADDIACVPTATDGKFRVRKCKVIGEKDISELV